MALPQVLDTNHEGLQLGMATNTTSASFSNPIPTATEPVTVDGTNIVIPIILNSLVLHVVGTGADDTTLDIRVFGFSRTRHSTLTDLYVPSLVGEYNCTLSTAIGIAGSMLVAADRFADTIAADANVSATTSHFIHSPENNMVATLILDMFGYQYADIRFDMTGATDGNVLHRQI